MKGEFITSSAGSLTALLKFAVNHFNFRLFDQSRLSALLLIPVESIMKIT